MASPHYPLDEVKRLVAAGSFFVMRGRALDLLVPPLSFVQARRFIAFAIQQLTEGNFAKTVPLTNDIADEYGITIKDSEGDDSDWYIKLCIDNTVPEVTVISFHPPQWTLSTNAGRVNPPKKMTP